MHIFALREKEKWQFEQKYLKCRDRIGRIAWFSFNSAISYWFSRSLISMKPKVQIN